MPIQLDGERRLQQGLDHVRFGQDMSLFVEDVHVFDAGVFPVDFIEELTDGGVLEIQMKSARLLTRG